MKVLETQRLILRHILSDDAPFILQLLNEPGFIQNIADRGVRSLADAEHYIAEGPTASYARNGFGLFLVMRKEGLEPIGMCGLIRRDTLPDVDIGYALLARFEGQGYATEAAAATLAWGRGALGLPRIVGITGLDNQGSIRVLEKIGLRFEKIIPWASSNDEVRLYATP